MQQLAEHMAALGRELIGYRGAVVREESPDPGYLTDNPQRRCPDLSKSRAHLGFHPRIAWTDGLVRTLQWAKEDS